MNEKHWWQSKGVLGGIGAVVTTLTMLSATVISIYGGQVAVDEAQLSLQIGALIAAVIALYGRVVAHTRIKR